MNKLIYVFSLLFLITTTMAQSFVNTDSLEYVLTQKNDSQNKMIILSELADVLLSNDPERALKYSQQLLEIAEINNNHEFRLQAYLYLSELNLGMTKLRLSIAFAIKAQNLAENMEMEDEYGEALLLLSKNYSELGNYEKSADLSYQALKIFEKHANKKGISKTLSQIGYIYFELGNWDKALENDLLSLQIAREHNDFIGISRGLNNIAAVFSSLGEFQNFKSNIREAIGLNIKTGNKLWLGINYANLGYINLIEDNYDSAFYYYKKAETLFNELNNFPKLAVTYTSLSAYYSEISNYDESLFYAKMALKLSEKNNLRKSFYEAAKRLHHIYLEQGDLNNAYKYCVIEFNMKDSLDIEQSMTKLSQLELLYEYEKLEQVEKNKRQRWEFAYIITGTFVAFLLIIILLILNNRRRIERLKGQKLESELNLRNIELTSNMINLMRKNEILSEISDKLLEVRNNAVNEETKSAIIKIAHELQKTTDNEIWEEFDLRFKQVHGEYYDKLLKRFPDLTPNEQKICAFLRLNMTTKEISELTGQRINTIEIARTRLRKKLGISNTSTNLINFLSQI